MPAELPESNLPRTFGAFAALLLSAAALMIAAPALAQAPSAAKASALTEKYLALREVAFSTHSEDVEVRATPGQEQAYGVIVEYWRDGAITTVVSFATGDSSLYISSGGGVIGGRGEPLVASAAQSLVAQAQVQLADAPLTKAYPPPDPGNVAIYLLTTAGLRGAQAPQGDIAATAHRLNPLFVRAQKVVAEFRDARS